MLCYSPWDARSFAFFSRPEEWIGYDGILVEINECRDSAAYRRWFAGIEPLGSFEVVRGGGRLRRISLYRCVRQTVAFPFDDLGRTCSPDLPHRRRSRRRRRAACPAKTRAGVQIRSPEFGPPR